MQKVSVRAELSGRPSRGGFANVWSLPGGLRSTESEKRDDLGEQKQRARVWELQKQIWGPRGKSGTRSGQEREVAIKISGRDSGESSRTDFCFSASLFQLQALLCLLQKCLPGIAPSLGDSAAILWPYGQPLAWALEQNFQLRSFPPNPTLCPLLSVSVNGGSSISIPRHNPWSYPQLRPFLTPHIWSILIFQSWNICSTQTSSLSPLSLEGFPTTKVFLLYFVRHRMPESISYRGNGSARLSDMAGWGNMGFLFFWRTGEPLRS